jgi:RsiW-degrading membrane proteinase PrsW (M82 family)
MNGVMRRQFAGHALQLLSWLGLAASLLTLAISAPKLVEKGGGWGVIFGNIAQYGWTIVLLLVIFAKTRTIGARALVGAALAGFFGISSMAVWAGKPFVDRFGPDSLFVSAVFAPVTEELFKLIPVAVFLLLAMRSRQFRPSIGDAVLFGITVAIGMSMYENILYVRDTYGGWFVTLPFSLAMPFIHMQNGMLVGGHVVYTALNSLALAVTLMYGARNRYARYALPITLTVTILEHMTVNHLVHIGSDDRGWFVWLSLIVTLWGYLSTLLLVAGVSAVAVFETRLMQRGGATLPASLSVRDIIAGFKQTSRWASLVQLQKRLRYESLRRASILAAAQTERSAPDAGARASVQRLYQSADMASGVAA